MKEIFERLESDAEFWTHRMEKMLKSTMLRGSFFASKTETIRELSEARGRRTANLSPQVST